MAATGTVRPRRQAGSPAGGAWEVIILAAWRDEHAEIDKARGRRDAAFNIARGGGRVAGRIPGRGRGPFRRVLKSGIGDHRAAWQRRRQLVCTARPPGRMLGALTEEERRVWRARSRTLADAGWAEQDRRAWRNEARARRKLTRRRDEAWASRRRPH